MDEAQPADEAGLAAAQPEPVPHVQPGNTVEFPAAAAHATASGLETVLKEARLLEYADGWPEHRLSLSRLMALRNSDIELKQALQDVGMTKPGHVMRLKSSLLRLSAGSDSPGADSPGAVEPPSSTSRRGMPCPLPFEVAKVCLGKYVPLFPDRIFLTQSVSKVWATDLSAAVCGGVSIKYPKAFVDGDELEGILAELPRAVRKHVARWLPTIPRWKHCPAPFPRGGTPPPWLHLYDVNEVAWLLLYFADNDEAKAIRRGRILATYAPKLFKNKEIYIPPGRALVAITRAASGTNDIQSYECIRQLFFLCWHLVPKRRRNDWYGEVHTTCLICWSWSNQREAGIEPMKSKVRAQVMEGEW